MCGKRTLIVHLCRKGMCENMKKNLPFIITMSIFTIACIVVVLYTMTNEPQYVRIMSSEITKSGEDSEIAAETVVKININTATLEDLQALSGIGEVKAKSIIDYREENGDFLRIEEIMEVPGIGEKMFDGIKEYITVK